MNEKNRNERDARGGDGEIGKKDSFYVVIDSGHIKQSSSKYEQYLLKFITFSISNISLVRLFALVMSMSIVAV